MIDIRYPLSFFFFKQKTANEMRISDWISDVCSSDLMRQGAWDGPFADADVSDDAAVERAFDALAPVIETQIGRASCRESGCQDVSISVDAGSLKKKRKRPNPLRHNHGTIGSYKSVSF